MNNKEVLHNIKVILCNTSHSGNIGATARAMKTMGLYNLILVAPVVMPDDHSYALATNAYDVLNQTIILDTLAEALHNSTLSYAISARRREFNHALATPSDITADILVAINNNEQVALVFGSEKNGLTIEQVEQCNRLVTILANPEYSSLNLSHAVQIIAYEIYKNLHTSVTHLQTVTHKSTFADNQGILLQIDNMLSQIDYYEHKNHDTVMRRLQNILNKASLDRDEVDLIRGMLHSKNKYRNN